MHFQPYGENYPPTWMACLVVLLTWMVRLPSSSFEKKCAHILIPHTPISWIFSSYLISVKLSGSPFKAPDYLVGLESIVQS